MTRSRMTRETAPPVASCQAYVRIWEIRPNLQRGLIGCLRTRKVRAVSRKRFQAIPSQSIPL
jgi:hypothetical protein